MNRDKSAIIKNDLIEISFPFSWDDVNAVKEIQGRKFDPTSKLWTVPATPWHFSRVLEVLSPLGFYIDPAIATKADQKASPPKTKYPKGLYPFQRLGVDFIYQSGGRAILADEMGLGKTITALAFNKLFSMETLVVCPANVVYKWGEEIKNWCPEKTYQIIEKGKDQLENVDIHIMSYGIMVSKAEELSKMPYDTFVADEAHYLKSIKSQRTKVARLLVSGGIPKILFLSGTPFMNRPGELFPLLNMLDPIGFPNFYSFAIRYCGAKKIMGQWFFPNTVTNVKELASRLNRVMIRRTKAEVEMDIPSLTRTSVPVMPTNKAEYVKAVSDVREWLRKNDKAVRNYKHTLTRLSILRQVIGEGKVEASVELAESVLQGDKKVVLYAHHKSVVSKLSEALKDYGVLTIVGDTSQKDREKNNKEFLIPHSQKRVMIISSAGGIGIDLYSASDIIFVEREWTPAIEEQAEARLQRYGQKNPVNAYYIVAKNTVDEKLDKVVRLKRAIIGLVVKQDEVLEEILEDLENG